MLFSFSQLEWWDAGVVAWDEVQMGKGDRLPICLVCNRQQWARKGPGRI